MTRNEKLFRMSGRWALASDGLQWILLHQQGREKWYGISFVRSSRDVLARCCCEKGVPADDARRLLDGLPATFDEWQASRLEPGAAQLSRKVSQPIPAAFAEPGRGLNAAAGHGSGEQASSPPAG